MHIQPGHVKSKILQRLKTKKKRYNSIKEDEHTDGLFFIFIEVALFLYGTMLTTVTKSGEPEAASSLISRIGQQIILFNGSKYPTRETNHT